MRALVQVIKIAGLFLLISGASIAMENETSCTICYENKMKIVQLECKHKFCLDCMKKHYKTILRENINRTYNFMEPNCPLCRKPFSELDPSGIPGAEDIKSFSLGPYKAASRQEKIVALVSLQMPEVIKTYQSNLIKDGQATAENVDEHILNDMEAICTSLFEKAEQFSDEDLIKYIIFYLEK